MSDLDWLAPACGVCCARVPAHRAGKSYRADGFVRAAFLVEAGERVVFEFLAVPGMLHIFSAGEVYPGHVGYPLSAEHAALLAGARPGDSEGGAP